MALRSQAIEGTKVLNNVMQ